VNDELQKYSSRAGEFYSLIFGMILGMMLLSAARNFVMVFVALELVSYSSYVLAGYMKQSHKSSEASLKYVLYGGTASGIMLFGISLLFGMTGSFDFAQIPNYFQASVIAAPFSPLLFTLICIFIFAGIGYKISSVPFHFWTPDVYEGAPTSITAYLSVASKAAGFAVLIRILFALNIQAGTSQHPLFDWSFFIQLMAILTMTVGNLIAVWQDNLKRMLAYSSIAHAGYMLAALAVFSSSGVLAVLIYFAVYLFMNLGAFLIVILIQNKIGTEDINAYNGLGYRFPFLGVCLTIFLISLTGLPPTAGFIGKLYLFIALVEKKFLVLAVIALLNSVVSLYYYVRVLKHMYLKSSEDDSVTYPVSFQNALLVLLLVVPTLLFGLYFNPLVELAKSALF
jgi:NADH-quinone oxidoreductase subunit N